MLYVGRKFYNFSLNLGFLTLLASSAFAAQESPQSFTFQGRVASGGVAVTGTVSMTIGILEPTQKCFLYEEYFSSVDLGNTGTFAIRAGTGTATTNTPAAGAFGGTFTFAKVFANNGTVLGNGGAPLPSVPGTTGCPGTYTSVSGDVRYLRVVVNNVVMEPNITINSVPQAVVAETLQGTGPDGFVKIANANFVTLTTGQEASALHNHDNTYVKIGGATDVNLGSGSTYTTGKIAIGSNTAPTGGSPQLSVVNSGATNPAVIIQGATGQTANLTEFKNAGGTVITSVNASGQLVGDGSQLTNVTGTDPTKVAKAGDSMTGSLNVTVTGAGASGVSSTSSGALGKAVEGIANSGYGVYGDSSSSYGVFGTTATGTAGNFVATGATTNPVVGIKGGTSTGDLTTWFNNTGTILARLDKDGKFYGDGSQLTNVAAGSATSLATNPADCGAGQYATTIAANGDLTCATVSFTELSNTASVAMKNAANTFSVGNQTVSIATATDAGVIVKGANAQSGNLQEWQNNNGTVLSRVNASGQFVGDGSQLTGVAGATAAAFASNPADCAAGQYATTIAANGDLTCAQVAFSELSGTSNIAMKNASNTFSAGDQKINIANAGDVGITVSGAGGQTADLQKWNNSTGTTLASVDSSGKFVGNGSLLTNVAASTAAALAANPADCAAGNYATTIAANGDLTCAQVAFSELSGTSNIAMKNAANTFSVGGQTISIGTATDVGFTVQGAAAQSGNLTEWKNNTGTVLASISSAGAFSGSIGGNAATATALAANPADCGANQFATTIAANGDLTCAQPSVSNLSDAANVVKKDSANTIAKGNQIVNIDTASDVGVIIAGTTGQTAALQQWKNVTGTVLASVSAGGIFSGSFSGNATTATALAANPADCGANQYATTIAANGDLTCAQPSTADLSDASSIAMKGSSNAFTVGNQSITIATSSHKGLTITGAAAQTGNLMEFKNSTGTVLSSIDASGAFSGTTAGNAATATALAANPADCGAGQYATTIAANGDLTCAQVAFSELSGTSNIAMKNAANTFSVGGQAINIATNTDAGLTITGAAAQSGDFLTMKNSTGTVLSSIGNTGGIQISNGVTTGFGVYSNTNTSDAFAFGVYGGASLYGLNSGTNPALQAVNSNAGGGTGAYVAATGNSSSKGAYILNSGSGIGLYVTSVSGNATVSQSDSGFSGYFKANQNTNTNPTLVAEANGAATANLIETRNSSGTTMSFIGHDGRAQFVTETTTNVPIIAKGASGQTAALTQWKNSTGTVLLYVNASGQLVGDGSQLTGTSATTAAALASNPADCSAGQYATTIAANGDLTCAQVAFSDLSGTSNVAMKNAANTFSVGGQIINIATNTDVGITVKGASGQSGNLAEYKNNNGTVLYQVEPATGVPSAATDLTNKSYVDTQAANAGGLYIKKDGTVPMTADLDLGTHKIINVVDPTTAQGAATKNYVDTLAALKGSANTFTVGNQAITVSNPGHKGLSITGANGQTANLMEFLNNTGTVLSSIDANGAYSGSLSGNAATATALAANPADCGANNFATTIAANGDLTCAQPSVSNLSDASNVVVKNAANTLTAGNQAIAIGTNTDAGLIIKGAASQSGNLLEFKNSTGTVLQSFNATGVYSGSVATASALAANPADCGANQFATTIAANGDLTCAQPSTSNLSDASSIAMKASSNAFTVGNQSITIATNTHKGLTIQGAASQSGALMEFKNDTGTVLSTIDASGVFTGSVSGGVSGNAATATALAANPADCGANQFATTIAANGDLTCAQPSTSNLSDAASIAMKNAANTFSVGNQAIAIATSTDAGLIIKGAASQSGNLLEFKNSTGTVLQSFNATGVYSGSVATASALAANPADCGANQFATTIAANGDLTCAQPSTSNLSDASSIAMKASSNAFTVGNQSITIATTTHAGLTINGASGQTGNAFEYKNSNGTILARIDKDGKIYGDGSGLTGVGSGNGDLKSDGTISMAADFNLNSHKLINVTDPASAQDAATKNYVDTYAARLAQSNTFSVGNQAINIATNTHIGLTIKGAASQSGNLMEFKNSNGTVLYSIEPTTGSPSASTDLANKAYVDTAASAAGGLYVKKDGTVAMTGALDMGTHKINNVVDPAAAQDAATKNYVDTTALLLTGNQAITNATNTNVALTIKGAASQSAHLLDFKNSTGTVLKYFDSAGAYSGNAATATALAVDPTACSGGQFVTDIAADGTLTCGTPAGTGDVLTTASNTFTVGNQAINIATNTHVGLTIKGAASQSGALMEFKNSTGTVLSSITSAGAFSGSVTGNASTATALAANPADCSANQFATTIAANGDLTCAQPSTSNLSDASSIAMKGSSNAFTVGNQSITIATTSHAGLTINGASGQTGNAFEYKNSNGTILARIDKDGKFYGDGSTLTGIGGGSGDLKADGTVSMTADFNLNSHKLINVTDPAAAQDAATKNYVDTYAARLAQSNTFSVGNQAINIATNTHTGLTIKGAASQSGNLMEFKNSNGTVLYSIEPTTGSPSAATDLANKAYVDTAASAAGGLYVKKDGTVAMTGALDMGTHKINNVVDPAAAQDAATKNYVDTTALLLTGNQAITNATNTNVALTIKGAASQSAHLLDFKNSTGTVLKYFDSAGAYSGNSATATALAADPTACSGGQFVTDIAADGTLTCGTPAGSGDVSSSASNTFTVGNQAINIATNTHVGLTIKGAASQSGALMEFKNSTGTVLSSITSAGAFSGSVTGNASTATALAANPADCGANNFATTIAANGDLTCAQPATSNLSDGTSIAMKNAANTFSVGGQAVNIATNTDVGVTVKGAASQSGALMEFKNSTGTVLSSVSSAGAFVGSLTGNASTATALAADPTACSGGQFVTDIAANGTLTCGTPAGSGNVSTSASNVFTVGNQEIDIATNTHSGLIIKSAASQSAALQQWQNSSGTAMVTVTAAGGISATATGSNYALYAQSNSYTAINALSSSGDTIVGTSTSGTGVYGSSSSNYGVLGHSSSGPGIFGESASSYSGLFTAANTANTQATLATRQMAGQTATVNMFAVQDSTATNVFTVDANGLTSINLGSSSSVGMVVKGASGQSVALQQWKNSNGTVLASVDSSGRFVGDGSQLTGIAGGGGGDLKADGTVSMTANFNLNSHKLTNVTDPTTAQDGATKNYVDTTAALLAASNTFSVGNQTINIATNTHKGLTIKGAASQSGNLMEFKNSTGTILYQIEPTNGTPGSNADLANKAYVDTQSSAAGGLYVKKDGTVALTADWAVGSHKITGLTDPGSAQDAATKNYVDTTALLLTGNQTITNATNTNVALTIKGAASQSANLLNFKNSTGTVLALIDSAGKLGLGITPTRRLDVAWQSGDTTHTAYFGSNNAGNDQIAVLGESYSNFGVKGYSNSLPGGWFGSASHDALQATASGGGSGVLGTSNSGVGVKGLSTSNAGIYGASDSNITAYFNAGAAANTNSTVVSRHTSGQGTVNLFETQTSGAATLAAFSSTGAATINLASASAVGMTIKGASSQTGHLLDFRNSTGTVLTYFDANGAFSAGGGNVSTSSSNTFTVGNQEIDIATATHNGLNIKGASGQSGALQQWMNSTGTVLASVASTGAITGTNATAIGIFGDSAGTTYGASIGVYGRCTVGPCQGVKGASASGTSGQFVSTSSSNAYPTLVAQGIASQTADLFQVQNSSGTALTGIDVNGYLFVNGTAKIKKIIRGTATYSQGQVNGGAVCNQDVTVTGAAQGDLCIGTVGSYSGITEGTTKAFIVSAIATGTNTVEFSLQNNTGAAWNPGSPTITVICFKTQ